MSIVQPYLAGGLVIYLSFKQYFLQNLLRHSQIAIQ